MTRIFPTTDHEGLPFGDSRQDKVRKRMGKLKRIMQYGGYCAGMCGDWAWHKQVACVKGWMGETPVAFCCWLCDASSYGAHDAYDFSLNSSWRLQSPFRSQETRAARKDAFPWLQLPGAIAPGSAH